MVVVVVGAAQLRLRIDGLDCDGNVLVRSIKWHFVKTEGEPFRKEGDARCNHFSCPIPFYCWQKFK